MRLDHLLSKDKTEREFMNLRSVIRLSFALSSFEGNIHIKWGRSSAGRAPALQAGGQEFDSPRLHHLFSKGYTKQSERFVNDTVRRIDLAFAE